MPLFSCLLLASALSPAPQMTVGPIAPAPPTTAPRATAPIDTGPTQAGESLALSELFDMIRTRSPRFKAEQAQVDIARSRLRGATAFPNPLFNFQVLHLLSGYNQNGFGTFTAYLQQPLLIAGQRRQRKKAARVAIQAAESSVDEAFHELAAEGRHLYVALQARQ